MSEQYLTIEHLSTKDLARIFSKIHVSTEHFHQGTPCWEWATSLDSKGYAELTWHRKTVRVHRLLYAWLVAPLPIGNKLGELDHLCERKHCVSPVHLEFVTHQANSQRALQKSHCRRGHPFTEGSYKQNEIGHRFCYACGLIRSRRRGQKLRGKEVTPKELMYGERNQSAKLTEAEIIEIRQLFDAGGVSKYKLAKWFNTTKQNIKCIVERKTWTHLP